LIWVTVMVPSGEHLAGDEAGVYIEDITSAL